MLLKNYFGCIYEFKGYHLNSHSLRKQMNYHNYYEESYFQLEKHLWNLDFLPCLLSLSNHFLFYLFI